MWLYILGAVGVLVLCAFGAWVRFCWILSGLERDIATPERYYSDSVE